MSFNSSHNLPIYAHEQEILQALAAHQVVIVEGPPGTGKTTQLPRILLRAGLIKRCMGITQPRRIAAVSVACRIAEEEQVLLGREVGYAIRFDDLTSQQTVVKVMTDGLLLQEAHTDAELTAYDIIMVDEVHERSLNIDFTLGLLKQILSRRTDLKVIISSATMQAFDLQRFFSTLARAATPKSATKAAKWSEPKRPETLVKERVVPRILIKTETYPVKIHYKPLNSLLTKGSLPPPGRSKHGQIGDVLTQQILDIHRQHPVTTGHILVFLPGEGLIEEVARNLKEARYRGSDSDLMILPLYSRLPREEQERVFLEYPHQRKVILATNIAETSLTIPEVTYVIDLGFAKIPWYQPATGVNSLRETPISEASCKQRAGRAGRTGPGEVIRLYSEESYTQRDKFTKEEILRTDLSEAVLRLLDLAITRVEAFPFPTRPPTLQVKAALKLLETMRAINKQRQLTAIGKRMVSFPLSPRLGRMVVEALEKFPKALNEVLLLGAFLSVRSPFLYPAGEEKEARAAKESLFSEFGDAGVALKLFKLWEEAADKEAFCKKYYVDLDTLFFIKKAHQQLGDIAASYLPPTSENMLTKVTGGELANTLRCLATGYADQLLVRLKGGGMNAYQTLSGLRVFVHPSSALYGTKETILVASELLQAERVYAFFVSPLKRSWLKEINPELGKKAYLLEEGIGRRDKGQFKYKHRSRFKKRFR